MTETKNKKYNKGFRIYQFVLLILIVLIYSLYLIFGNGEPIGGVVSATLVNYIVILLVLMQIHTLLDAYKKLNKGAELAFSIVLAGLSAFIAFLMYEADLPILFPIIVGIIAISHLLNLVNRLNVIANNTDKKE